MDGQIVSFSILHLLTILLRMRTIWLTPIFLFFLNDLNKINDLFFPFLRYPQAEPTVVIQCLFLVEFLGSPCGKNVQQVAMAKKRFMMH